MPWTGETAPCGPGVLEAGYRGGWFHPGTGYSLPVAARLVSCHPNPFNPQTTVAFTLDREQSVAIAVHDVRVAGREPGFFGGNRAGVPGAGAGEDADQPIRHLVCGDIMVGPCVLHNFGDLFHGAV